MEKELKIDNQSITSLINEEREVINNHTSRIKKLEEGGTGGGVSPEYVEQEINKKVGKLEITDNTGKTTILENATEGIQDNFSKLEEKQDKLTAGENITIENNVISAKISEKLFAVRQFILTPELWNVLKYVEKNNITLHATLAEVFNSPLILYLNPDTGENFYINKSGVVEANRKKFGVDSFYIQTSVTYFEWMKSKVITRISKEKQAAVLQAMEVVDKNE